MWLHTMVRFTLGTAMTYYGWNKIFPAQFGPGVEVGFVARQVAYLEPQQLLWVFMGASRLYTVFSGVMEMAGGLLLFSRRTTTLGALIAATAITNVFVINLAYDVVVKLFAGQLLAMCLLVLAPHAKRLSRAVLNIPTSESPIPSLFAQPKHDKLARVAGAVLATGLVLWMLQIAVAGAKYKREARNAPLYGIWEVESKPSQTTAVNADVVDDSAEWWYFVFSPTAPPIVISRSNSVTRYAVTIDARARAMSMTPWGAPPSARRSFVYDQADDELVLRPDAGGSSTAVHLRRVDVSQLPLVSHKHHWNW